MFQQQKKKKKKRKRRYDVKIRIVTFKVRVLITFSTTYSDFITRSYNKEKQNQEDDKEKIIIQW